MTPVTAPIRRGTARRLGVRHPRPPIRLAKLVDIQDYGVGEFYAVAGANGRTWIEDTARRAVRKPLVVIQPGMIRDQRSSWIQVRGLG